MKWLLDTNVVSESVRSGADRRLLAWMAARSPEQVAISIVTVAELRDGTSLIADDNRRESYLRWIEDELKSSFDDRLLPLTLEILIDWLSLARRLQLKGRPRSAPDLMIAATARVHDLILVSRNTKDFIGTDVILYNPWSGESQHMSAL